MKLFAVPLFIATMTISALAQGLVVPAPLGVPKPGPVTRGAYAPQPILSGGIVIPLFAPDSPFLNPKRISEAEIYNMDPNVPGRIASIVNIHNPSIEVHFANAANNTGAVIILVPGGGHNTLNVASGGADLVSYFFTYGINTVIIRSRLRRDGYDPKTDEVYDLQQAIRLVRAHANEWHIDPRKIGAMGFSAGAELAMAAAISYGTFDRKNSAPGDPLEGVTSRPDFVGAIYPGPSLFAPEAIAKLGTPVIPKDTPPSFITCAGWGDKVHAVWADEYFGAMLRAGVPNVEMHIYAIGVHGGGLNDRDGTAFGTWQNRFIDWFRDLGFLRKPGVETLAAKDLEVIANQPAGAKH
jgi:endo-1,4-beta-xylanase